MGVAARGRQCAPCEGWGCIIGLSLPWPYVGGAFDKPKTLEELAERVQLNFDAMSNKLPNINLDTVSVFGPAVGLRVVAGAVDSAGAGSGSGFTASKTGTGDYAIAFTSGLFLSAPYVVAMTDGTSGPYAAKYKNSGAPSAGSVDIQTFDTTTGTFTDCGFYFVAIGAR